jgi:hypothetical protein
MHHRIWVTVLAASINENIDNNKNSKYMKTKTRAHTRQQYQQQQQRAETMPIESRGHSQVDGCKSSSNVNG